MAFVPKFTIRSADNVTQLYTFPAVQSTNLPQTVRDTITITNQRARGAVIIDGGIKSFEAKLDFVIWSDTLDYEDISSQIDTLETTIPINTPFILRMDKTSTTYYEMRIKRLVPFDYQDVATDQKIGRQKVSATFLTDSW